MLSCFIVSKPYNGRYRREKSLSVFLATFRCESRCPRGFFVECCFVWNTWKFGISVLFGIVECCCVWNIGVHVEFCPNPSICSSLLFIGTRTFVMRSLKAQKPQQYQCVVEPKMWFANLRCGSRIETKGTEQVQENSVPSDHMLSTWLP